MNNNKTTFSITPVVSNRSIIKPTGISSISTVNHPCLAHVNLVATQPQKNSTYKITSREVN